MSIIKRRLRVNSKLSFCKKQIKASYSIGLIFLFGYRGPFLTSSRQQKTISNASKLVASFVWTKTLAFT